MLKKVQSHETLQSGAKIVFRIIFTTQTNKTQSIVFQYIKTKPIILILNFTGVFFFV